MNTKIAVLVFVLLVFLSAQLADAQQPAASLGLTCQSLEGRRTKDCDDAFRVATNSGKQAFIQRDHPIIGNERKRIMNLVVKPVIFNQLGLYSPQLAAGSSFLPRAAQQVAQVSRRSFRFRGFLEWSVRPPQLALRAGKGAGSPWSFIVALAGGVNPAEIIFS